MAKVHRLQFRLGTRPNPAGAAYDAPTDLLVGWEGGTPSPDSSTLNAYGASLAC